MDKIFAIFFLIRLELEDQGSLLFAQHSFSWQTRRCYTATHPSLIAAIKIQELTCNDQKNLYLDPQSMHHTANIYSPTKMEVQLNHCKLCFCCTYDSSVIVPNNSPTKIEVQLNHCKLCFSCTYNSSFRMPNDQQKYIFDVI